MATALQISISFPACKSRTIHDGIYKKSIYCIYLSSPKVDYLHQKSLKVTAFRQRWSFFGENLEENGILVRGEEWKRSRKKKLVLVRFNNGFGFNGGGGGKEDGATARLLGNIALAIGLTYLSVTGQLGWLLDAIVSIWVFSLSFLCLASFVLDISTKFLIMQFVLLFNLKCSADLSDSLLVFDKPFLLQMHILLALASS